MKKYICIVAVIYFLGNSLFAQKVLTTADYTKAVDNLGNNLSKLIDRGSVLPQWLPDGNFWYKVSTATGVEFVLVNAKTGVKKTAATRDGILPDFKSPSTPSAKFNEVLSPDGTKAAYIKNWNLWLRDIATETETALTADGVKDFGYATDNAGWTHSEAPVLIWSPDSKKISTFIQDQRHVKDFYLVKTTVGAPQLTQWKYPLPGDSAVVKIHRVIIDVTNKSVIKLKTAADDHRSTLCDDVSCSGSFDDNDWSADGSKLAFVSTPRDHKSATLRIADASTGDVTEIYKESVSTQYESGQGSVNWRYLPASKEFIWYSEKDNWGHLYLHDITSGKLKNRITEGTYVVTKLLKATDERPVRRHLAWPIR